jgi:hypothetical protein
MADFGALTLRIQAEGTGDVLRQLTALEQQAKQAAVSAEGGFKGAGAALRVFDKSIAETTSLFSLQARTADVTNKQLVSQIRDNAAAQLQWMQQVGASEAQQLRFAAAIQTFERRVQSATKAQNQNRASLVGMGRDGRSAMIGLGFAISQMASTGEASLLSLARQISTITALLGGKLGIAGIGATIGIGIFDFIRARAKVQGEIARDAATQGARDVANIQKAQLQQEEAAQRLAFDRELSSLKQFYDARQEITQRGIDAEIAVKRAEVRSLGEPIAGESKKETADRLLAQQRAAAEIVALERQGLATQIALAGERENAERSLKDTLIGFETQRLEAQGDAHSARLRQIDVEAEAFRRALGPAANAEERVQRFVDAMVLQANLAREQVQIGRLQTDLETKRQAIQNELKAGRITELQAAREVAKAERDALPDLKRMVDLALRFAAALGDKGAQAELEALRTQINGLGTLLTPLQQRMQSVLANIDNSIGPTIHAAGERIRQMIEDAGGVITVDIVLRAETLVAAAAQVDQQFASLGQGFGSTLADSIAAAASGSSGGDVLLRGLGSIMQQMGGALLTYGLAMQGLLPSLLNPFTSGPAAIAAGITLTALGAALGAAASGRGGRGSTTSTAITAGAASSINFQRLIIDPNAAARDRVARSASGSLAIAGAAPRESIEVIGIETPRGQKLIGTANARYTRRGG